MDLMYSVFLVHGLCAPKALGSGEDGTSEAGASFAWWLLFPSPSCGGFHPWSPPAVSALPFQRKALIPQGAGTGWSGAVAMGPTQPAPRGVLRMLFLLKNPHCLDRHLRTLPLFSNQVED